MARSSNIVFDILAKDKTKTGLDRAKRSMRVAGVAIAAGLGVLAASSVTAFVDAETQQAKLAAAFEKYPALASSSVDALGKLNTALQSKTRFEDESIASAQATLATMGLTGEQLEKVTPLLLDYAEKTGTDLDTAAQALGKSFNGQTRALKNVGINYKSTGDQATDFANITAALEGKVGGVAETMGTTAAGKADILRNKFGEIQEVIGAKLVPALSKIADVLIPIIDYIATHQAVLVIAAGVVGTLLTGAFIAWTASIWAANVALLANPITWIVLAIVALIAVIVVLVVKWKTITQVIAVARGKVIDAVKGMFEGVKEWLGKAWDFIKKVWSYSPLGLIVTNWDKIMDFFGKIPDKVKAIFTRVTDGIKDTFKAAFNWVARGWNNTLGKLAFTIPDIPGVPGRGKTFEFPDIPYMARGGDVMRAGLAVVGERGAEIVSLPAGSRVHPNGTGPAMGGGRMHPDDIRAIGRTIGEVVLAGIGKGIGANNAEAYLAGMAGAR